MRILAFGATGKVGGHFVRLARERGHEVTAVARRATPGCVVGQPMEPGFVQRVMPGHDAVMSGLGMHFGSYVRALGPDDSPVELVPRATQNIVDAMKSHGVRRVSIVSAAGVRDARVMNWPIRTLVRYSNLRFTYGGLARGEEALEASGLDWQAVRPVTLTHALGQRARVADDYPIWAVVAREAVARFMLDELERRAFSSRLPILRKLG